VVKGNTTDTILDGMLAATERNYGGMASARRGRFSRNSLKMEMALQPLVY